jgi:hypothetical protein
VQSLKSYTWTPTTTGPPVYPQVFATPPTNLPGSALNSNSLPDDFRTSASGQAIGTLEHVITPSLVVGASGVYTHHWNVDHTLDNNIVWTWTAWVRPDPACRALTQYQFDG